MKILDEKQIEKVRIHRDGGICLYGLFSQDKCSGEGEIHHIIPRSILRLDDKMNLITLCRRHHHKAEMRGMGQSKLFECLETLYKYDYTEFKEKYGRFIRS